MALFDELKDKVLDLAQAGAEKTKELTEVAKLNLANSMEENNIKKAYAEIGKLYYAERGASPEAGYVALCEKVAASMAKIEENKAKLSDLKASGEVQDAVVDSCGCGCEVPMEEESIPENDAKE